jgi:hypothetical protein
VSVDRRALARRETIMKNTFYGIGPGWPAPEERGLDKRNSEHYPMPPVRRKSLQQQGCGLF